MVVVAILGGILPAAVAVAAPSSDVMVKIVGEDGHVAAGRTVMLTPIGMGLGRTKTHISRPGKSDSSGRARFALSLTAAEQAAVTFNGGWLNLEAMTFDASGLPSGFVSFSRYMGQEPSQRLKAQTMENQGEVALRSQPALAAVSRAYATHTASISPVARSAAITPAAVQCSNYHWELYSTDWNYTKVGELHSASDTPTAKFTYGNQADSDIDVGYKSGSVWSISGSIHISNSHAAAGINGGSNYNWGMKTKFEYTLWFLYADCLDGAHQYMGHQQVEAEDWMGGSVINSIILNPPARIAANSDWFPEGGFYTRDDTSFKKFGGAVSIFGASLGAKSGASTTVKTDYVFGSGRHVHWLFGNNAHFSRSQIIYASNS